MNKLIIERYTLPYKIEETKQQMIDMYGEDIYNMYIFDITHYHDCVKLSMYGVE